MSLTISQVLKVLDFAHFEGINCLNSVHFQGPVSLMFVEGVEYIHIRKEVSLPRPIFPSSRDGIHLLSTPNTQIFFIYNVSM
jgi:hypothetical protein